MVNSFDKDLTKSEAQELENAPFIWGHFHEPYYLFPPPAPPANTSLADDYYLLSGGPLILTGQIAYPSGYEFIREDSLSRVKKLLPEFNDQ